MNNVQNATELREFPQNDNYDRPHGQPDPYHGDGTFGRCQPTSWPAPRSSAERKH